MDKNKCPKSKSIKTLLEKFHISILHMKGTFEATFSNF
jgi:Tfp pilus assembly protein PilP